MMYLHSREGFCCQFKSFRRNLLEKLVAIFIKELFYIFDITLCEVYSSCFQVVLACLYTVLNFTYIPIIWNW